MAESHQSLSRDMSLFDVTMIGVGAMIGAGIFVLTGEAAGVAGPALILAFALNGVVTLLTAMVYAELGSAIPEAGGGYLWIKEGLPGANAFLAGWMSWFAHSVAGALYALGFGAFTFSLLGIFGVPIDWMAIFGTPFTALGFDLPTLEIGKKVFGLLIVIAFAYINFRGASETGLAGNVVTVAKLLVIGFFCFFGLKFMFFPDLWPVVGEGGGMGLKQLADFIPAETGWVGILSAMGLTFIAFEGYEIIVQAGEEVENPRKNIPKAVFLSLAIVIPIYMLVAFVLIGASDTPHLLEALERIGRETEGLSATAPNWKVLKHVGELGLAEAAALFVPIGAILILLGGLLSTMSALNATTFSSTRVSFAMGRDRNLPDAFGKIHPERRTPHIALFWTAVLIGFMVLFVPITTVAAAADIMFLLLFMQVNIAAITIRKKYGDKLAYGYLMPFYPLLPIVAIAAEMLLALFMFHHYPSAWGYVGAWLVVGFGIYQFYARTREREKKAPPILLEERPVEIRGQAVLVAVAEPEAARARVRLGAGIAHLLDGELLLMHAIIVPPQLPGSAAREFVGEAQDVLARAREHAEEAAGDVPIRTLVRVGHRPADAISHTATDYDAEYLIMGWRGEIHGKETVIGHNIDRVLLECNAHAVVMQEAIDAPREILVPLANPATAPLALAVATQLVAGRTDAGITVLHLTPKPLSDEDQRSFREAIRETMETSDGGSDDLFGEASPIHLEFDVAREPVIELAQRSADYDAMIIGTSHGGFFRRKVFGRVPTLIAERSGCPVVFIRAKETGLRFNIQQFFQFFRQLEEAGRPEELPEEERETAQAVMERVKEASDEEGEDREDSGETSDGDELDGDENESDDEEA